MKIKKLYPLHLKWRVRHFKCFLFALEIFKGRIAILPLSDRVQALLRPSCEREITRCEFDKFVSSFTRDIYSPQLGFRQGVTKIDNLCLYGVHEGCKTNGNTTENSNANNVKALFIDNVKEGGFSLIEVMLATLILSIGLLGFAQGQIAALRISEHAYFINLADLKNNELAERIRSCSNKSFCIQEQLNLWREEVHHSFPQGEEYFVNQGADYQSKISWFSIYQYPQFIQSLHLLFRL